MLERVISGGQTGADQASWRAARSAGLATGGWMPRGFLTEDGPRPGFAGQFGAVEHESVGSEARTIANVRDSDGTLIFAGGRPCPGTALTIEACRGAGVPYLVVPIARDSEETSPDRAAAWVSSRPIRTLNVAGERESHSLGIGAFVEGYLAELFRRLSP